MSDALSVGSAANNSSYGSASRSFIGLGKLFAPSTMHAAPSRPPSPPMSQQQQPAIVPQYDKDNRKLLRSPLPSPTIRKKLIKPLSKVRDDDCTSLPDDGQKQRKREEAHISRLVHMAKAQQNLMTAWFAASEGAESLPLGPPPPPRRQRRPVVSKPPPPIALSKTRSMASERSSGPIDLDSGDEWNDFIDGEDVDSNKSVISQISNASTLRMSNLLSGMLGGFKSNRAAPVTDASVTDVSKQRDIEDGSEDESGSRMIVGEYNCSKAKLILVILMSIFFIAISTIVVSMLYGRSSGDGGSTDRGIEFHGSASPPPFTLGDFTNSPSVTSSPSTPLPSVLPSGSPSVSPTQDPSQRLSGMPSMQPSLQPSVSPSNVPTSMPSTTTPSSTPSANPTLSPTRSLQPSGSPSLAPSTVFSTAVFEQVGSILDGSQNGEQFGYATATSANGSVVAVGARYHVGPQGQERRGRVQVFQSLNGQWTQRGNAIFGRNLQDQFGFAVALSDDGNVLAVSEPGFDGPAGDRSGNVRVFTLTQNVWLQVGQDIGGEQVASLFGLDLSLSADGTRLAIGSPYHDGGENGKNNLSGRVRVYRLNEFSWQPLGQALDATRSLDWFGWSVDLSGDGSRLAVGAPRNRDHGGRVLCFDLNVDEKWRPVGNEIINDFENSGLEDRFGLSVALHGNRIAVGAPWHDSGRLVNAGLVAVYELSSSSKWNLIGSPLIGTDRSGQLGNSVQLKGDYLAMGSPGYLEGTGKVDLYKFDGTDWDSTDFPLKGQTRRRDFGYDIALNSDATRIVAGSPTNSDSGVPGSIQVFQRM